MEADYEKYYSDDYDPEEERRKYKRNRNITYLIRELNADPSRLANLKALMDYRDLRTLQVWYPDYINELKNDPSVSDLEIQNCEEGVKKLDKERRDKHNKALGNFYGLVNDMKRRGIPAFYEGKLMDPSKEPGGYGDPNIRKEMTDSFLGLLYDIEELDIEDIRLSKDEYAQGISTLKSIKQNLERNTRQFGLDKPILEDDGDSPYIR